MCVIAVKVLVLIDIPWLKQMTRQYVYVMVMVVTLRYGLSKSQKCPSISDYKKLVLRSLQITK